MRVKVIILAAGQGKRFKAPYPKVLAVFRGKPMVAWVVDAVEKSRVTDRPVVVVGAGAEQVRQALGERCEYVLQEQQLGTGHAVAQCRAALEGKADAVLVLYGDHPLVAVTTVQTITASHERERPAITMATATIPDFREWRVPFGQFGRIIRGSTGDVARTVEVKDATPQELEVREVNPCYFCFDAAWLWAELPKLSNRNRQGEYYLTDLVGQAISEGRRVVAVPIHPEEALGANDPDQLQLLAEVVGE
ncbi:MAG: bifunctional UDP-N-acetylglucosamine pyrophosphorylase / Glucosamine-1-phosphate N-acetyltransferase [Parcubacteria group bacterium Gr01-1014_31]|nr:MAG: bifunctional UDP-N-acetylglucosamine pyrophosphorylase / Glucosamine-1-phosphate N-acetyltransferase [Parcubacteria group bacterium Gr01-1014_31]